MGAILETSRGKGFAITKVPEVAGVGAIFEI